LQLRQQGADLVDGPLAPVVRAVEVALYQPVDRPHVAGRVEQVGQALQRKVGVAVAGQLPTQGAGRVVEIRGDGLELPAAAVDRRANKVHENRVLAHQAGCEVDL